jgi:hypothetical protein
LATGAELVTDATTLAVTKGLLSSPSLTTKLAAYVPARSAVKVGLELVKELKTAALPVGFEVSSHL